MKQIAANKNSLLTVLLLITCFSIQAQDVEDAIKVIARPHKDSIVLRWAPSSPAAWKILNEYGYKVERYTLGKDRKPIPQPAMKVLAPLLKPAPQNIWEQWVDKDDMVAVAAQAIFGEEFKIDVSKSGVMEIYQKARELEMRYSFGLFAADLSPIAANLSALRYVDRDVRENEMYLYRIYSLAPETVSKIEFGFIYTGPAEAYDLPPGATPEIETATENSVLIRWETYGLKSIYIAYYLERSLNKGKHFEQINKEPMSILMSEEKNNGFAYSALSDTVIVNREVHYRIRGVNSFGEVGPPSDVFVFTGEHAFTAHPTITKGQVVENQAVYLEWNFDDDSKEILASFDIERSSNADDGFEIVASLSKDTVFKYLDRSPLGTNYYRIAAVSNKGMRNYSYPYLIQLEDSIPPLPPQGIKAIVDTTGLVKLTWFKNTEQDFLGYRVYRSAFRSSEFGQVTTSPVDVNAYTDTITVNSLTRKIYYKLVAIDNRFNPSDFSQILEVRLPDIVPPVPPVISGIKSEKKGVTIQWVPSSSNDVRNHILYRRRGAETDWKKIKSFGVQDAIRQYEDSLLVQRTHYEYALVAEDSSGLHSVFSTPVRIVSPVRTPPSMVKVKGSADRTKKIVTINWQKQSDPAIVKYAIYRAIQDAPMTMYKSIAAPATMFEDDRISMNTTYVYRVKALYDDGRESALSDEVIVKY